MSKKYVHYGDTEFKLDRFEPISNRMRFNKPYGGLWASPCDSEYGWYDFCICHDFNTDRLSDHFIFTVKDDARILTIKSHDDLVQLRRANLCLNFSRIGYPDFDFELPSFYPDFEKLLNLGCDAIEVYIQDTIYMDLYGWDCDSLLVLNPDCVATSLAS